MDVMDEFFRMNNLLMLGIIIEKYLVANSVLKKEAKTLNKTFIKIFLLLVIISMGLLLIFKHDTAFVQTMKIRYADGCTETYVNNNLTTPECTAGRILVAQKKNIESNYSWNHLNLSTTN
jgi:hypothetical protein